MERANLGSRSGPAVAGAAPMAGITDLPFRLLARHFGADFTFTEMVSAQGLVRGNPHTLELLRGIDCTREPVVVQVFGSEPAVMAAAAESILSTLSPAGLDINMGCPVSKVVKSGAGAALMRTPGVAARIVSRLAGVLGDCRLRPLLSVKMRTGWDAGEGDAAGFAARMEEAGAELLSVHGRTRAMLYSGRADWETIAEVVRHVSVPVLGSGDVCDGPDAVDMLSKTGCAGVMVGRAAIGSPWVFCRIASYLQRGEDPGDPPPGERLHVALEHLKMETKLRGERRGVVFMRRQLHRYVRGLPGSSELRERMNHLESFREVRQLVAEYAEGRGYHLEGPSFDLF
ncbi:MAG: tRNA dihydrouridine synthase DusB [Bacillota bacterium]